MGQKRLLCVKCMGKEFYQLSWFAIENSRVSSYRTITMYNSNNFLQLYL